VESAWKTDRNAETFGESNADLKNNSSARGGGGQSEPLRREFEPERHAAAQAWGLPPTRKGGMGTSA
jgi:hypothetical protein